MNSAAGTAGQLASLRVLHLGRNKLNGTLPGAAWASGLTHLVHLGLEGEAAQQATDTRNCRALSGVACSCAARMLRPMTKCAMPLPSPCRQCARGAPPRLLEPHALSDHAVSGTTGVPTMAQSTPKCGHASHSGLRSLIYAHATPIPPSARAATSRATGWRGCCLPRGARLSSTCACSTCRATACKGPCPPATAAWPRWLCCEWAMGWVASAAGAVSCKCWLRIGEGGITALDEAP